MHQIVIDELSEQEQKKLQAALDRDFRKGPMTGLYWIELPEAVLSELQLKHTGCAPFAVAAEQTRDQLRVELLVRSRTALHCDCIAYATPQQRQFILETIDSLLQNEQITA